MKNLKLVLAVAVFVVMSALANAHDNIVVIPLGKHDSNLLPENICVGVTILNVSGTKACYDTFGTVTSAGGRIWLDRNLGASRVASSVTDTEAYGDLYQWGRGTDGHEKRTSLITSANSTTDASGHGGFITEDSDHYDWRTPQNDNLWQGVSGTNNPCPSGFRLPTSTELDAERMSWSSMSPAGAFASPLKLVLAGERHPDIGTTQGATIWGVYWSSTVNGLDARTLNFGTGGGEVGPGAGMFSGSRAFGNSVRCIKD